ncbi:MAG: glycosyltransferase [Marinilabiliaceae bacterium]
MSSKNKVTIIVPVFNEEESLPRVKTEADKLLQSSPVAVRFLFVDDKSGDSSLDLMKQFAQEDPSSFSYISLKKNSGLSTALKAGIDCVETPYTGYIDSDLQTSPQDFLIFFDFMEQYTMINGIRQKRSDSIVKKISSKIANGFRRVMINDGIEDTCCPLKIMETKAAQTIPFFKGMHRFIPALVQLQGGTVKQIPVQHFPRIEGTAKYHLWNRLVGPFMDTLAFVWMRKRNIRYEIGERSDLAC